MVEDQGEVRILGGWIEYDTDECVDRSGLGNEVEVPSLRLSDMTTRLEAVELTCLFLNWIKVSSFLTIS